MDAPEVMPKDVDDATEGDGSTTSSTAREKVPVPLSMPTLTGDDDDVDAPVQGNDDEAKTNQEDRGSEVSNYRMALRLSFNLSLSDLPYSS